jgi:CDGSH-type Zn-finger protein
MPEQPKILIKKDGPYILTGHVPLQREVAITAAIDPHAWSMSESYPDRVCHSLCRCGKSERKPYCDNSHGKAGFDGTETAPTTPFIEIAGKTTGPGLDLLDAEKLCSGARFCDRLGGTWKLTQESHNPAKRDAAIEQACNCPSGRLVAVNKATGQPIEPFFPPSVSITQDPGARVSGPLWVKGGIPIESENGAVYETRNRVTLCRCGGSKNKPFCDGQHLAAGFDDGEATAMQG